jgi:hypothetical protein
VPCLALSVLIYATLGVSDLLTVARRVRHYSLAALIAVERGVFALGAALIRVSMRAGFGPAAEGLLLGVAAGVLFGVSDIALKYLSGALQRGLDALVSEWTAVALAASVLAFYASARGLQLGPGVAVIAFTSVAANLAAITGGVLVFRDPIGIGAPAIAARAIAFGLVITGAALMPAPARTGRTPQPWDRAREARLLPGRQGTGAHSSPT